MQSENGMLLENISKLQKLLSDTQDNSDVQRIETEKLVRNYENQLETMSAVSSRVSSRGERETPKSFGYDAQNVDKLRRDLQEVSRVNDRLKMQNQELVAEIKDRENDENKFSQQVTNTLNITSLLTLSNRLSF